MTKDNVSECFYYALYKVSALRVNYITIGDLKLHNVIKNQLLKKVDRKQEKAIFSMAFRV